MTLSPIIPIWIIVIVFIPLFVFVGGKSIKRNILIILIFVMMLLVDLRFKSLDSNAKVTASNIDILFVVDNTISMVAEDYNGKERRIDAIIEDCDNIIGEVAGGKFGLIVFSHEARVVAPFTTDANMVKDYIKSIKTPIGMYAKGTNISAPLDLMYDILSNYKSEAGRKRVLFYISDGEITNGEELASFSKLRGLCDFGYVLGYGTTAGGNMKAYEYNTKEELKYVTDRTQSYPYPLAVSKIDEGNLKKIASDIGIEYVHMTSHSQVNEIVDKIRSNVTYSETDEVVETYSDSYYYYAIGLAGVLVVTLIMIKKKLT